MDKIDRKLMEHSLDSILQLGARFAHSEEAILNNFRGDRSLDFYEGFISAVHYGNSIRLNYGTKPVLERMARRFPGEDPQKMAGHEYICFVQNLQAVLAYYLLEHNYGRLRSETQIDSFLSKNFIASHTHLRSKGELNEYSVNFSFLEPPEFYEGMLSGFEALCTAFLNKIRYRNKDSLEDGYINTILYTMAKLVKERRMTGDISPN